MKKSITKNYIYNLTYQILRVILPILTTPYISRVLGAENIGIYGYTLSISAYFILFGSLGINMYGQREIAYYQEDKKQCSKIFWEIIIFRFITMMISLSIFKICFIQNNQYSMYYKILTLEILGNCLDISWFFQGKEEFKKTVSRNLLVKFISIISIFIFIRTKNDLIKYYWIYVLSILIGNISLWLYIPKNITKIKIKDLKIIRHIKPTLALFIPQIAIQIYTLLDKTMIGILVEDKAEVGYYEQAQKIISILLTVTTSLSTVMMPRIANIFAKGENEKVIEYTKKSLNLIYILAIPLIFGIILVSDRFVPIFFGEGYEKTATIMKIISPIILLIGISNVTGTQYLLPTKRQKEYTISVVCGAIVNFVLNSFFIYKFRAIGASISTVIAEATVTGIQLFFIRKDLNLFEITKILKNYLISGCVMFICCNIVNIFEIPNMANIILKVSVGGIVYIGVLLILKDRFLNEMIKRILKKEM